MSETTSHPQTAAETVPVRLLGGPADWHRRVLTDLYTDADLSGPRERLGTYLISSGVPADHPDPGARAVYEPDAEPAPSDLWFFRGWFPAGPTDPEHRTPDHEVDLVVTVDGEGLPTALTPAGGEAVPVDRVLAHWEGTGEDDLGPEGVWHVATPAGDWCLSRHLGDRWTGGALPAVPPARQEHPDLY